MTKNTYIIRFALLSAIAVMFSGCAKFTAATTADLTPFAEQTIAMLGETDYGFKRDETLLIQEYIDRDSPDWKRSIEVTEEADDLMFGIMLYSINLVTLSDSPKTEAEKIAGLVEYLATFQDTIADGSQELSERFDTLLVDVRAQTDYLAALRAVRPLVEAVINHGIQLLEENDQIVQRLAIDIQTNIATGFAVNLRFKNSLKELEEAILEGLELIHRFYLTADPGTLETLAEHLVPLYELVEGTPPSLSDVPKIQDDLIALLGKIHQIREYQSPEFDDWQAANKELDRIYADVVESNSQAALALIVWGQAYQKMTSGVTNPAEWFSMQDLIKLGGKAIEKAL